MSDQQATSSSANLPPDKVGPVSEDVDQNTESTRTSPGNEASDDGDVAMMDVQVDEATEDEEGQEGDGFPEAESSQDSQRRVKVSYRPGDPVSYSFDSSA